MREAAVSALGAIADSAVAPLLLDAVRHAEDAHDAEGAAAIRRAAIAGLIEVGSGAHGPLLEALRDRDARLREAAIEALGGVGGPDSVDRACRRSRRRPVERQAGGGARTGARGRRAGGSRSPRRAVAQGPGHAPRGRPVVRLHRGCGIGRGASRRESATATGRCARPPFNRSRPSRTRAAVDVLCAARLEGDREVKASAASALRSFEWTPGRRTAARRPRRPPWTVPGGGGTGR